MLIVFTTTSTLAEAESLAEKIVAAKIAACVQVLPQMKSFYFWDGKVQNEAEHLLLIKTLPAKYSELETFIQSHHSYQVPEIVAVSAEQVSDVYLDWMTESLSARVEKDEIEI